MPSQQKHKRKTLLEGWRRFVVSSFVVRQLLAKSNKIGTKTDHKCDQSGPGGRKGYPKINEKISKTKNNAKVKKQSNKNKFLGNAWRFSQKVGGLNGLAFTMVLSTTVIKIVFKT